MRMSVEPVRLAPTIEEALALVEPLGRGRGIRFSCELDAVGETYVRADLQRLKQVLLNLLANAVKYNHDNGFVRIAATVEGDAVDVDVVDTGAGLTADDLSRLFVPFERLRAAERGIEGTGLGLALSHRLANLMGGELTATSVRGRGSTFTLRLVVAQHAADRTADATPMGAPTRTGGTASTVLYIEDNRANTALVEQILARRGNVKLIPADTGLGGLDLARTFTPDAILLDLDLPDTTGERVLEALLDDPRTREIPVLIVSADATRSQIARLIAAGARAYITKPIDVARFSAALDALLDAEERAA
jgi:CheY-like chemotaxis protein/anti-sigma regulatory factor (Ser/Thr protein kinase)